MGFDKRSTQDKFIHLDFAKTMIVEQAQREYVKSLLSG